jgi:hypothetical protein
MREWLLGLVPVVLIIDFLLHPAHLTYVLLTVKGFLR